MQVRLLGWFINAEFGFATAMHDGYARLRESVIHYRSLLSLNPSEWVVSDYLEGCGEHSFTRHFHFPPRTLLKRVETTSIFAIDPASGNGLQFIFPELESSNMTHAYIDEEGLWSKRYGCWAPAPRLRLSTVGKPPLIFSAMIRPIYSRVDFSINRQLSNVSASPLLEGQAVLYRKTRDPQHRTEDMILMNPSCLNVSLPGGLWSDARFLFLRQCSDGTIEKAFVEGEGRSVAGAAFELSCQNSNRFAAYTKRDISQPSSTKVIQ